MTNQATSQMLAAGAAMLGFGPKVETDPWAVQPSRPFLTPTARTNRNRYANDAVASRQASCSLCECPQSGCGRAAAVGQGNLCRTSWPVSARCQEAFAPLSATMAAATPITPCSGRSWAAAAARLRAMSQPPSTAIWAAFRLCKMPSTTPGAKIFGSGWVFVTVDSAGKLALTTRPNQDTPLMDGAACAFRQRCWEHAYYLKYQNRRADYLKAWWSVVDWGKSASVILRQRRFRLS